MAETTKEVVHKNSNGSTVGWIALVIAIIALVIGWIAYNRTGQDLESRIQQEVNQAIESAQQEVEEGANTLDQGPDGVDEDTSPNDTTPTDTNTTPTAPEN